MVCVCVYMCVYVVINVCCPLSHACTPHAGIGPNLLLARLATKRAKPNGQHRVRGGQTALDFLADLSVDSLPGVGWSMSQKLKDMGITTVRQVRGGVGLCLHKLTHQALQKQQGCTLASTQT